MSVMDQIKINTHYTRSINLERDADSVSIVDAYIPTTRAVRTLIGMAEAFKADESPRAWSLVGPYGSGKSSFAVFLAHLLSNSDEAATRAALKKLGSVERKLANRFRSLTRDSYGYCTVLLTGSPEGLGCRLVASLAEKSKEILHPSRGPMPNVVKELLRLSQQKEQPAASEILAAIEELQNKLADAGYSGLLIVIDELGKFLEYEARHYGANDIFLLQAIAEHALAAHPVKLSLVVMLHQAFEQYARGLGESLKNEWAKVQGRFENIPFLESAEQTLRVVAAAIEPDFSKTDATKIAKSAKQMVKTLAKAKAIPGTMDEVTATDLFARCYPLHPVSALLLPILCQKVAQNERTLFSYLGSRESFGFRDGVSRCAKVGDWIQPWEIYEYFILNQSSALTDHLTHRRWAEVVIAVERLADSDESEVNLLKAVGLLNIIGVQGGLKASKEVVGLCLPSRKDVSAALEKLQDKSILQYRKFSAEFRVWQGSDFDLDAYMDQERGNLGRFDLADILNARHSLLPIVARKYSIQNGALRYFVPSFADAKSFARIGKESEDARIIFYLAESKDDEDFFQDTVANYYSKRDITVLCHNSDQLRESVAEVIALENVQKGAQELNADPVAQREFSDRFNEASAREEDLLARLTGEPEHSEWRWSGKKLEITNKRSLQNVISEVLKKIYSKSPIIRNELINRDKPSAQANAAKNKLAIAMFNEGGIEDLGVDKFPPEKAIYRAVLRETRLHVLGEDGKWRFQGPISKKKKDDPCSLYPVWELIEEFLDSTELQAKSLIELNKILMAPPYGIKEGILPILYVSVLMANQEELAIYEGRVYTPYLSEEQIERFLKRPDDFTVQRFRIAGLNQSIHKVYSETIYSDGKQRSLLALAKPLAKMILDLPPYVQSTEVGLSLRAQGVRDVFRVAKSPIKLMLEDLPAALGVDLVEAKNAEEEVKQLSVRLTDALRELKYCLPSLKLEFRGLLAQAFSLEKDVALVELREAVAGRCRGLEDYTIDRDGLKAFILRALSSGEDEEKWFDDVLNFLGQKPTEKWSDAVRDSAEYQLVVFTRKLAELEKLRLHYQEFSQKTDGDFDVYLLRSLKKGAQDHDEVIAIDKRRHNGMKKVKSVVLAELEKAGSNELKLAVLAEVVDEFLSMMHEQSSISSGNKGKARKLSKAK